MIRRTIQKHFYLLLSVVLVLVTCFLVGFGLMQYSGAGRLSDVIDTNQPYLMAWRILVYIAVIVYWPHLVHAIILKRDNATIPAITAKAYRRQPVILVCLVFEVLIVQNIVGALLTLAVQGVSA